MGRKTTKTTERKKIMPCKHSEWVTFGTTRKGSEITDKWKCTKCGKIEVDIYTEKPKKPKKMPIRRKVLRRVWRYFCPDCGKQMETHDMSGGHGGGGIYWKCPYCDLYIDKD